VVPLVLNSPAHLAYPRQILPDCSTSRHQVRHGGRQWIQHVKSSHRAAHLSTSHHCALTQVPQLVPAGCVAVSNHDGVTTPAAQVARLAFVHFVPTLTTKHTQVSYNTLSPILHLERRRLGTRRTRGNAIDDMHRSRKCFRKQVFIHVPVANHGTHQVHWGVIESLVSPVLMRVVRYGEVWYDPTRFHELFHLIGYIFTTVFRTQHLQLTTGLFLHHGQPLFQRGQHIRLVLNRIHPGVIGPVIRECRKVVGTAARLFLEWAFDISVYEVQDTGGV